MFKCRRGTFWWKFDGGSLPYNVWCSLPGRHAIVSRTAPPLHFYGPAPLLSTWNVVSTLLSTLHGHRDFRWNFLSHFGDMGWSLMFPLKNQSSPLFSYLRLFLSSKHVLRSMIDLLYAHNIFIPLPDIRKCKNLPEHPLWHMWPIRAITRFSIKLHQIFTGWWLPLIFWFLCPNYPRKDLEPRLLIWQMAPNVVLDLGFLRFEDLPNLQKSVKSCIDKVA
jgi:hypothetical protein